MGYPIRLIVALCLVGSTTASGHTIEGRIVGVHDGDTITLLDADNRQHKIRLDGIDAPELGQPFGRASKQHLVALVANREAVAECGKADRYGREICRVLVRGADAGLAQLRAGMAWYFRRYAKELPPDRRQQYADMETQAQAERRGLWTDGEPVPPWDWRAIR
jgi:endonuclease YncB( thermonuclease family)